MKTYDVLISLRVVSMRGGSMADSIKGYQAGVEQLAARIAADTTVACEVRGIEVVDLDSLPQPAHLCARCNSPA